MGLFSKVFGGDSDDRSRSQPWIRYTSGTRSYSIEYPKRWRLQQKPHVLVIASPEGGIFSVAGYTGELADEALIEMLRHSHENDIPISEISALVSADGWRGYMQLFHKADSHAIWMSAVACHGSKCYQLNAFETAATFEARRPVYERMLDSFRLVNV